MVMITRGESLNQSSTSTIIDLEVLFMNVENSDPTSDYISVPECQHQSNSECLEECAKSTN